MEKELIIEKIDFIKRKIDDLKFELDYFKNQKDKRLKLSHLGAAERWAEEIIESSITINNKLLSKFNIVSTSYYESFILLKKLNLFDNDFIDKIASSASFRNRLAHDYINLDEKILLISLELIPKYYIKYLEEILKYIDNNNNNNIKNK